MIGQLASRMPAQNAVDSPTGPAPMIVMSTVSSLKRCVVGERLGERRAVERAERALDGGGDAGERRGVALGVGGRLGRAQALDEVEEARRVVGLERDDELLVVEAERVRRVEVDVGVLAADLDVLLHDPPALVGGLGVPLARLDERVDEQVAAVAGRTSRRDSSEYSDGLVIAR